MRRLRMPVLPGLATNTGRSACWTTPWDTLPSRRKLRLE
jgi:hypothetical protein